MQTKIFIACFLGAFIGSLVALQMHAAFWWVGMIVGAGIGYLSYEFRAVLAAIPRAYHTARGWRPDTEAWRKKFSATLGVVGQSQTVCAVIFLSVVHTPKAFTEMSEEGWRMFGILFIWMHAQSLIVGLSLPARDRHGRLNTSTYTYKTTNPVSVFFWYVPKGVWWLLARTPNAIMVTTGTIMRFGSFMKRFSWNLFREIHSDIRLLCACDAAIGTAVGYFTGNAVLGGVAGAIFGVLNYEIVSKRILGLSSAR